MWVGRRGVSELKGTAEIDPIACRWLTSAKKNNPGGTKRARGRRVTHVAQPRIHLFVLCEVAWLTPRPAQKQDLARRPRGRGRGRCSTPQRHAMLRVARAGHPDVVVRADEMVGLPEGLTVELPVGRSIVAETVGELGSRTYVW